MIGDYVMTKHAAGRALDMLVTADEVRAALLSPEVVYNRMDKGEQCEIRQAGRIALALKGAVVTTVLHREVEQYSRDDIAFAVLSAREAA
ncbi:hypothetical protein [Nonomuraea roseola]|uniref:DUF4258 domain-containing protein n=1 Tax=Nonomuraea roseola TaxID=46179 RepID=A0ABV5Q0N6_9ACTN